MADDSKSRDKLTIINELAIRRGFFWQSYGIYGGVSGFVTYGYLGTKLKQNIERKLRELFVNKLGILEVESPVIAPSQVFEASGHIEHFKEPMVECKKCKRSFRADHLLRELAKVSEAEAEKMTLNELREAIEQNEISCPECKGEFGEAKQFLTMFKTAIGPYSDSVGYGRPEAAQGIFVEFNRLFEQVREKLPFGAIQIGHALRNEISPRQGLLRLREFTIADLEFFFDPEHPDCHLLRDVENEEVQLLTADAKLRDSDKLIKLTIGEALAKGLIKSEWQAVFMAFAKRLLVSIGVPAEYQRFIEKLPWERAHYSLQSFDQEVTLERWGWTEVSGHAYRTDFDLKSHMHFSGSDMTVFREYKEPIEVERLTVKPVMPKLGPIFKKEATKVGELLSKADPKEVEAALKSQGYFMLGSFKVLPEQVNVVSEKTVERGRRFLPHVVEPSFGSDRLLYVALEYAYCEKEGRAILGFPRDIAPVQLGVYPLMSRDGLPEKALELEKALIDEGFVAEYDEAGSIGRRYARADEVGVPLGVTVDYETLENGTVTIRDRDSWKQVRAKIDDLSDLLRKYFAWKLDFGALGTPVEA